MSGELEPFRSVALVDFVRGCGLRRVLCQGIPWWRACWSCVRALQRPGNLGKYPPRMLHHVVIRSRGFVLLCKPLLICIKAHSNTWPSRVTLGSSLPLSSAVFFGVFFSRSTNPFSEGHGAGSRSSSKSGESEGD